MKKPMTGRYFVCSTAVAKLEQYLLIGDDTGALAMRQQREAPARWVTVCITCITQASVWFCDFPSVADMFVVCGPVIFSLGRRGRPATPRP